MRTIKVNVTDDQGVLLDQLEFQVRDGVYELYIMEVVPGSDIIESGHSLTIGTGGTVWQD